MKKVSLVLFVSLILLVLIASCAQSTPTPSPKPTSPVSTSTPTFAPTPTTSPTSTAKPTATPTAAPGAVKWICQNTYAGTDWGKGGGMAYYFADYMKKVSDGRFIIDVMNPEAVVPTAQVFNALKTGTIQMSYQYYAAYHVGVMPEADVQIGLPFSWTSAGEAIECYLRYGLLDKLQPLYAKNNTYMLPVYNNSQYLLLTTFPIDTPDGLKGKKMRATALFADWVKAFGGVPTVIPPAEYYTGLKLGTIDGIMTSPDPLQTTKLQEVVKYVMVSPNLCAVQGCAVFNLDALNALPADLKTLLLESLPPVSSLFAQGIGETHKIAPIIAQRDYGVKLVTWTGTDLERARAAGFALWDTVAAKSPQCAELVNIIRKQMKDLGRM